MPNQRKKGKKRISFWLTEAECDELKEFADSQSLNMTDAMRVLLIEASKKVAKAQTVKTRKGVKK